jgi:hypothetical protein
MSFPISITCIYIMARRRRRKKRKGCVLCCGTISADAWVRIGKDRSLRIGEKKRTYKTFWKRHDAM